MADLVGRHGGTKPDGRVRGRNGGMCPNLGMVEAGVKLNQRH